ncbi:MAG: tetratricopeptide repeat protein, partial [Nitrospinota bacterium]
RSKMGEEHLEKGEFKEAEDKFKRALAFDEENVKAKFGLGKTHLEQGKTDEAMEIFNELSQIDSLFEEENKHVFNEFGIELRKLEKYDLAIANYEKAITIDALDEALYYNLARAYDKKDLLGKAIEKLKEALKIEKDFPEAQTYLSHLMEKEKKMIKDLTRTKIDDFK